jgi:sulfide:quinone oxidoreductase
MGPLRVLVAGGGVAGVETVLALRHLATGPIELELLTPGADLIVRPLSVRTPFDGPAAPRLPVERLGIPIRQGGIAHVDPARHEVRTTDGSILGYDRLVVAVGARAAQALDGALHFHGPRSAGLLEGALRDARSAPGRPVAFVVPVGLTWPLPLYELALAAAKQTDHELCLITPEARPLELFGPRASDAVARLLDQARVEVRTSCVVAGHYDGALVLEPGGMLEAAATITLPTLTGPRVAGLPSDADGFLPVDAFGRVLGARDVFAAGDATDGAVKQGGLACQQADAVAAAITGTPHPGEPVLRAILLTGRRPLYLRTPLTRLHEGTVSSSPLWTPEAKVAGRHIAGFLARGDEGSLLEDLPAHASLAR